MNKFLGLNLKTTTSVETKLDGFKTFFEPIYLGIFGAGLPCRFKAQVDKVSNLGRMT